MICDDILAVHRRIRVGRLSALNGQCKVAHHLMTTAGRELANINADGATKTNACARALAKGTGEFLAEGRRQLRERCGPTRGTR